MSDMPRDLQASRAEGVLRITWSDGRETRFPFVYLRGECGCAGCIEEGTGRQILDKAKVPRDIVIQKMELVGNYAVRISWSDGHDTGLYTWQRLGELAKGPG